MQPLRVDQFCICGHSIGAHSDQGRGRCGFCSCSAFLFDHTESTVPIAGGVPSTGEPGGERLSLRQAAARLKVSASSLRRAAAAATLPAEKRAGKWTVLAEHVNELERRILASRNANRKVRGHLAQAIAFQDLTSHLYHQGRLVSEPALPGSAGKSRAGAAVSEAIEHQLNPTSADGTLSPSGPARTRQQRARSAQRKAVDDMIKRPGAPHPPERSL